MKSLPDSQVLHSRRDALTAALSLAGASLLPGAANADLTREIYFMTHPVRTGNLGDFDFLVGSWQVANRRLRRRWVGSNEWDEFPARFRCTRYLDGVVSIDEIVMPTPGSSALTMKAFDFAQRRWSIHRIDSRTGVLIPPLYGGFDGERGEFYGEDTDDGRVVKLQFIWTRHGPDAARWQQAVSLDGRDWETNWVMDLPRA
jgi:hypothetical protein